MNAGRVKQERYIDCMRTLWERWKGARLRFHPDPPPLKLSATLCVLRRPPTTTNDLQRSSGAPPPTSNVLLRSAPFSCTLDELCPERCSET